jgi:hypothetical protein
MRKANAACALALASVLVGREGAAQRAHPQDHSQAGDKREPGDKRADRHKTQPLNLRHENLETDPRAEAARVRMRAGDCAGALDLFDDAIRTSADPTVRRDRGLCQETLGHAYPAMDDLRAYLMAVPDAADAGDVRERLGRLEQTTLGYSSASVDVPDDVEGGASEAAGPKKTAKDPPAAVRDSEGQMDYVDHDEELSRSSLRGGRGWSVAPYFSQRKWGASPAQLALAPQSGSPSFGDSGTWAECVGLGVRYSFGPTRALVMEAGYELFNSTATDLAVVSGLSTEVGVEWRFPLDPADRDQLILTPGLGYEHLAIRPSAPQASSTSLGGFVPRVRFGWRRMLASSAALDVSLDAGVVNFFAYSHFPYDSNNQTTFLVAANVALLWGL